MCGISGVYLRAGERADPAMLREMAQASHRRGPDAEGVHVFGPIGFSHRRLKVIDLSQAANQPLSGSNGETSIVFNGEVYNFIELRRELESRGRTFRTRSDTEVILQAYEEWGTSSFARLNGMFAFAILDARAGGLPTVHLVRDRFGIKPVFFCVKSGRFAFASELKPLLRPDWVSRDLDLDSLAQFLKFSHVPSPRSIFRDIRQLEAGRFLTVRAGEVEEHHYYDRTGVSRRGSLHPEKPPVKTEDQWLSELDTTLKSVVARQLESDVPVGCFLSGGIDSSLLALTQAALTTQPIDTFTIAYREREFDESQFAREVARAIGSRHHEITVTAPDLISLVSDMPDHFDQPFADPTLLPTLILARGAREHVTVALSGDGADELFFGYPYQRALMRLAAFSRLPRSVRGTALKIARPLGRLLNHEKAQQWRKLMDVLHHTSEPELFQNFIGTIGPLRADRMAKLVPGASHSAPVPFESFWPELAGLDWRAKIDQVFLRTFLTDTVLTKTDRAGMAYGLEARVPFLDDQMVDFSARLPFEFKSRPGQSKYLLRRLLASKLPGNLAQRRKQGFSIPLRDWLRSEMRPLLKECLDPARLRKQGLLDADEVGRLVDEHLNVRANHSHLLFSLMTFQLWKERYLP